MQDDVVALFAYDRWASTKALDACRKLTAEQYVAEPVLGWSSSYQHRQDLSYGENTKAPATEKGPCSTIFFTILQEVQTKLPAFEHLHDLRKLSERYQFAVNDKRHRVLPARVGNAPPQRIMKR
jgi:hypothetical protein